MDNSYLPRTYASVVVYGIVNVCPKPENGHIGLKFVHWDKISTSSMALAIGLAASNFFLSLLFSKTVAKRMRKKHLKVPGAAKQSGGSEFLEQTIAFFIFFIVYFFFIHFVRTQLKP